jgi:SnoaL-like domain
VHGSLEWAGDDMKLEEMLAREAIRYTVSRYNSAIDRSAYAELADVFMPDGSMAFGGHARFQGRDAIIAALTAGAEKRGAFDPKNFQRHLLGNSIINVIDDKTARSVHYIMVVTEIGLDHSGLYVDDFVKAGDRWLIAHRQGNLEWVRPDSRFYSFPGASPTAKDALDLKFQRSAR